MEWLPYEEWLSKTGITQLRKERANGPYCRGIKNSHTNLIALRDAGKFGRVLVICCLIFVLLHSAVLHILPEMLLIYPFVLLFTIYFPNFLSFYSILIHYPFITD